MREIPQTRSDTGSPWLERAQAAALVLPAAVLLWFGPGTLLAGDPNRELTGTAVAAVAALPALVVALVRRTATRVPWALAFTAFVAVGLAALYVHAPTDTLEADRASLLSSVALASLLGGASLGFNGRTALVRALTLLALFAIVPTFVHRELRFAGALGNTGSTSEIAALGALAGAWLFARDTSAWRWVGGASVPSFAVYCGVAPVLSGVIVLAVGFAVALFASRGQRAWIAVLLAAASIAFVSGRLATSRGAEIAASARSAGDTGGAKVRELIWKRTATLIGDYGLLGAGPGQFAAAFPPYRDGREIELSSHGRTFGGETEVEHAHNDVLQGFVDAGIVGGCAWVLFFAAVTWKSWRALRASDDSRAALGAVALAALVNSLLREPLLWNPASSSVAFAVFGALLGEPARQRRWIGRAWIALVTAAIVVQLPRARNIVSHGRALAAYLDTHDDKLLANALSACPDSIDARELSAHRIEKRGEDRARTIDGWRAVLAIRPHRVEALMQLGKAYALDRRVDAARAAWSHALALDPKHPALLGNLARLEALLGDIDESVRWCGRAGVDAQASLRGWAVDSLRELDVERGWALFARADSRLADLTPERAYRLARDASLGLDPDAANALEGSAHVSWARQHAEGNRAADAVRVYRQAKRCLSVTASDSTPPRWSPRLHLELAGALALDGKLDDARRELDGVQFSSRDALALPAWAGEALLRAGLLARGAP